MLIEKRYGLGFITDLAVRPLGGIRVDEAVADPLQGLALKCYIYNVDTSRRMSKMSYLSEISATVSNASSVVSSPEPTLDSNGALYTQDVGSRANHQQ